ncbi:hypothetical protein RRG08_007462 [Elysia crispata]|uniref:phosphoglycerate mutase (2,3-diphosphoglycerate-dependent) n=1 Tax=Elysia crispata TaxID=231223 RepID=A0AAE0XMR7_9GAST|nr:hypothetical protein RRG08_007462 [Elysia crispata]
MTGVAFHNSVNGSEGGVTQFGMGKLLLASGLEFDVAYTSVLKRAIKTLYFIQEEMDAHWLPVVRSWRLNEKHQGALQGCNKKEMAALHGEAQLKVRQVNSEIAYGGSHFDFALYFNVTLRHMKSSMII